MAKETEKFIIDNVEPIWSESRELSPTPRPASKVGVRSADVQCKSCNHSWRARNGDGSIDGVIGGTLITCPNCRESESVRGLI